MATENLKPTVKYKFGPDEFDLADYIHNIRANLQSYLNSKDWNEGLKLEFINAYNKYLTGFQDLLTNNTNRFSTNDVGSIIDSSGEFSNTDNDDIDPVGSEYYYDDKGNRITTDDFNTLRKRKLGNYNTFSANRLVATYFNKIGTALRQYGKKKSLNDSRSNAFNLSKHGFLANWNRVNNPAGGNLNLDPYLEKDAVDEATGKRDTTNRAAYLKEQIENYISNIGDYDFSSTPFKDRDTYISRLRAAAENLGNGYNSEDVIALNQAGIGNEFLSEFFSTGELSSTDKTELELSAEAAVKEMLEREKREGLKLVILNNLREQLESLRDTFFDNYLLDNPFKSSIRGYTINPTYDFNKVSDYLISRSEDPDEVYNYIKSMNLGLYLRDPSKKLVVDGKDITKEHISNNLDLARRFGLLKDLGNGNYAVPGTENYDNWTFILYNPNTKIYEELSMLLNELLRKAMAYDYYLDNIQSKKEGGILKLLNGGTPSEEYYNIVNLRKQQMRLSSSLETTKPTTNLRKSDTNLRKPALTGFTASDKVRLGAIGADIASLIASLTGVGSIASAAIGAGATAANLTADMMEGKGFWESLGDNAISYGLDAISLIPFAKAAKVPKMIKSLSKFTPYIIAAISATQGIKNGDEIISSFKKLGSKDSLTVDDWRNIASGVLIAIGGTAASIRASKANSRVESVRTDNEWVRTELGYRNISKEDMKKLREATSIDLQNEILKPYNATLKESRNWRGKKKGKADISDNNNYVYDFDKTAVTYSGDLPILHNFGIGEKWLGKAQFPDIKFPKVRSAYNKVFHPLATKRQNTETPKPDTKSPRKGDLRLFRNVSKTQRKKGLTSDFAIGDNRNARERRLGIEFDKQGGILDRIKRFLPGGIAEIARLATQQALNNNWFTNLYSLKNLTGWDSSKDSSRAGASITNPGAMHGNAGDLSMPFYKNLTYTSDADLVGLDLLSYYNSDFKGKSIEDYVSGYNANAAKIRGYWDLDKSYGLAGATEHNRLFRSMFGNRSNNSNDAWNIGYDQEIEDIVGSSTWLRRMDLYEKEFDALSDELKRSRIHKIDLGNGNVGYVYKKANGDIAVYNLPVTGESTSTENDTLTDILDNPAPEDLNKDLNKSSLFNNPTLIYGLPRAVYADRMNRRMTDMAKESLVPLLKDPLELHRYTRSDLDAEMLGERNYADLRKLASKPITSDGSLLAAILLQAEVQGLLARTAGREKSNLVQRLYDELAWKLLKENAANRHEVAMFNRALQWGVDRDKSKLELAYLSKKHNIWDIFGQLLEYDAKTKQLESKTLADNFARSDIKSAVSNSPNDYGADLTTEELDIWNKVLSGTNPSSLSAEELNSYRSASQKVLKVITDQLRQYYNIPYTPWSGLERNIPWSATIHKKGGSVKDSSKIAIAGIKAKTADAERFQKLIKECIDRNEKALNRFSKSLYGIIKQSIIQ